MSRRYFGTDGVRGIVGADLTPELVERRGGRDAVGGWRTRPRRPRHARVRARARGRGRSRDRVRRRDRGSRRRPSDPGGRAARGRPRRRRLGVAQPARVQRREALPGRRQARRRAGGGDRGAFRRVAARRRFDRVPRGRAATLPRPRRRALWVGSLRPADRRRLRERRVLRPRAAAFERSAPRCTRSGWSPMARTSTSAGRDRPRALNGSSPRGLDLGRLRRRRRPDARRRRARRARRRRPDHRRARAPPGRRPRSRDGHDESRVPRAHGRARLKV